MQKFALRTTHAPQVKRYEPWLQLAAGLAVAAGMARYYWVLLVVKHVGVDVQDHLKFILNVCERGYAWPPNPGFSWLVWLLSGRACDKEALLRTAAIVLGICWGAAAYLSIWAGREVLDEHLNSGERPALGYGLRRAASVAAALAACFMFPPTVSALTGLPGNYLGLLPPNVYHNSTLLAALPFSIAAFGLAMRQLKADSRCAFRVDALLGGVLVAGALCKPSYAFVFVPAYGLLRLGQVRRHSFGRLVWGLTLAVLPVLLLILGQTWWIDQHPEILILGKTSFAIGLPAGWVMFLPNLFSTQQSYMLAVGSFALPLLAYLLRPTWLRQPAHQLAVLGVFFAFIQFMLVYETGLRASHGNFTWQVIAANHLLYWVVALSALNWQPSTTDARIQRGILLAAVVLSVTNGILYMAAIVSTNTYL
jgi:hypothetical protein